MDHKNKSVEGRISCKQFNADVVWNGATSNYSAAVLQEGSRADNSSQLARTHNVIKSSFIQAPRLINSGLGKNL